MKHLKTFEAARLSFDIPVGKPLIPLRRKIAEIIERTDLPDDLFKPQGDKWTAAGFIKDGKPSEYYLHKVITLLRSQGVDLSELGDID